ncbi:hypothetical protein ACTI_80320 [Actinoplanes sp. OR16]|uniref:SCO6745 family protein n=1 Tax=Actinoplanes sp. OR16 TaxID=946334 RepID=UPI000F70A5DD|nr:hypothetical protein [Actinoplanes sp. OR16]BBH71347.1 hypothetical protein ACTI_80320 [Actinoplanes sp. OR16]
MTEHPYRLAWRVTEPIHAMIYFVPEAPEAYAKAGLDDAGAAYFASRGAVFGPCGPGIVTATFYNFNPAVVARALPAAWEKTTPAALLAARHDAVTAALTRGLGDLLDGPEVTEAAALARIAAEAATELPQGRPLFAAHAELPWPDRPHLALFHAQTLLREFRGDGHVAALLAAGLSGLEAVVLYVASGQAQERFLRGTRGWSRDAWAAAQEGLRSRGLLDGDGVSEAGRELRAGIEEQTDRLAAPAYEALGEDRALRLAELTRPLSRTLVKAGFLAPGGLSR